MEAASAIPMPRAADTWVGNAADGTRSPRDRPEVWPGGPTITSSIELATALRRAAAAHGEHAKRSGSKVQPAGLTRRGCRRG